MSSPIRIITIAREFGSGGAIIGGILASRLGWALVDHTFIDQVAAQLKLEPELVERWDERVDTWFYRTVRALWLGGYEGSATASGGEGVLDAGRMARLAASTIGQAAGIGNCVIVGRGGQCLLRHRDDTFHVFIYGPWREKIVRVRERFGVDANAAAELMRERDHQRVAYVHSHFQQDWCNRRLYQMLLDSGVGVERAASAILVAAGLQGTTA